MAIWRDMIVPVSGDVWCIGFHKDRLLEYEDSARKSLAGLEIWRAQEQINTYVDRIAKPEILDISDVARHRKWTICQIGDLRFAPYRTKLHYRGQVTHYRDPENKDRWFRTKEDEYGTPYGPKSKGSNEAAWTPLHPRLSERPVKRLSPAARAKQSANKANPIPCPMTTDEELEAFRRKMLANGKLANDNERHNGLPYDVESADELQFGYAFGKTYSDPKRSEPSDEPTEERKQTLAELNARLSPQARCVANMVVLTDETNTLAQAYADVGAIVPGTGVSGRTLMRRGQRAVEDAAQEINAIRQALAA
jgi:hypothetical protein